MVELRIGENRYPLVLTVGALDRLAQRGVTLETLPKFITPDGRAFGEAVENCFELLGILAKGGADQAVLMGREAPGLPDLSLVRLVLTPGQLMHLCDAACLDGLKRTVEADHTKNAGGVEAGCP